jgi:stage V sporulation protein B
VTEPSPAATVDSSERAEAPGAAGARTGDAPPVAAGEMTARAAGRGGIAVAAAKIWFILVGVVQQTVLPRFIGMEGYGAFSTVLSFANIANNVVTTSSIQGVSRAVAGAAGREEEAQRRMLVVHAALAPCLAAVFFAIAPLVADFEHAPHILSPLRIFAIVLFVYALYTPLVGALNGRRRFLAQAGLDVTFATLRTIGMLGAAYALGARLGGIEGAAIGVAIAAAAILPVAWWVAGTGRTGSGGPSVRAHFATLWPIAVGQFFLNLLMHADIWLLRRFAHEAGEMAGVAGDALRARTDSLVAAYRAAQLFAFLPYQLLLSITFILFPMLARARAQKQDAAVAGYVSTGVRLALILGGLMVSCTSGLAPVLLRFAYVKAAADDGAAALRVLALGQGAFAIFGIETTVLVSLSRERMNAVLTFAAMLLVGVLCWVLVPSAAFDRTLLVRTAIATSTALGAAALAGAFFVRRTAGAFAPPKTLVRTAVATGAAIAVASVMPWLGHLLVPIEAALVVGVYVAVSIALGELTRADLAMVRNVLGRSGR